MATTEDEMVTVRLLDFPLAVHKRAQEHHEELIREFALLALSSEGTDVPVRLRALVEKLTRQYGMSSEAANAVRDAAFDRGEQQVDLEYQVPRSIRAGAEALGALLDEADEYCRTGDRLLTLASPPEAVAFRKWYLAEFNRQLDGQPPIAWPDSAYASRF